MLQLAIAACLGAWAYVPADLENDVAFKLTLGADGQFTMEFSDFARASGRWNRHRDNTFDLMEGAEKIAMVKDCRDDSATVAINDRELLVWTYQASTYPVVIEDTTSVDAEVDADTAQRRWEPVQSGRWLIRVNESSDADGAPACSMITGDFSVGARRHGHRLIVAASASSQTEMSRLRANTSADVPVTAIFDGDVRVHDDLGRRTGRYITVTGFAELLDFIEAGTSVTLRTSTDLSRPISLAGSAAAGSILRRCADHVASEAYLYRVR